jgi:signal transduction histidine kinase
MKIKSDKYKFKINCNIQENVFAVCVGEQIRQIFINLLDNAIKYGEAGTTIDVGLKTEERASNISEETASDISEGTTVNIYIKNYGKCIPDDMLDKIFEPFVRADKSFSRETGSSGLGLSIVKAIIDKHKGKIIIKSKAGVTEVIISLQLCNNFVKTS